MSSKSDFAVPTQSQLDNLITGCFVRVQDDKDCYWVEIDEVSEHGLAGVIHAELEGADCQADIHNGSRICFHRAQVTHVGCDRYCFC